MLWLLHEHHLLPGSYRRLPEGEKALLRILYRWVRDLRESK